MSGMQVTDFAHSPLSTFRSIRLLELQPSSDVSSDICCKIYQVVLDDEIKYKASSYVWGDPNITLPILQQKAVLCYSQLPCRALSPSWHGDVSLMGRRYLH